MESYLKISNSYNVSSRPTAWDPHPQMNLRQFGAALICARCPEPSFECKKVPNYNSRGLMNQLPIPWADKL